MATSIEPRTLVGRPSRSIPALMSNFGLNPGTLALFALLAVLPLFIRQEYLRRILVTALLLGSQAMAFNFTLRSIEIINFGFAAFVGAGAYVSALLVVNTGMSPWLGFLAAAIVAAVLGLGVGALTLRLQGLFAACMTWFLGLTLQSVASAAINVTRGYLGLNVPYLLDSTSSQPYYYVVLPIAFVAYVVLEGLSRSYVGLACRAVGQNSEAAQSSGVNPTKYRVINFTVSCAFAGVLGAFYAHFIGVLTPDVLGTAHTTEVLAIAFIGGRTSLWGSLLSALTIGPIFEYLRSSIGQYRYVVYGLMLVLTMIYYPLGLTGLVQAVGRWLKTFVRRVRGARSGDSPTEAL